MNNLNNERGLLMIIDIAKDFSVKPFGRDKDDGKFSGERFREEHLLKAFENIENQKIEILLDGVSRGYGSSFLDEAFAGLIRSGINYADIKSRLIIKTEDTDYKNEIWEYIEEQRNRSDA
jgi:hypothetical protein